MSKSPEEMAATMIANLKEKTGKTLEEWLKVAAKSKAVKHGELVKHLKADHGMTHGFANLVAHSHFKSDASASDAGDLVTAQYGGEKAILLPVYEAVIAAVKKFGADVEISPKKGYVSLRRKKQFALIQPSTKTRVDIGINLKGADTTDRLEKSGSFNAMVSHRVRLGGKSEVDKELISWLKEAYQQS